MLTRNELIQNSALLEDKVYGAMIGLAIGDSLGDAARKPENRANYGLTTDFNQGASWSTDDTEFALLTAHTLLACKGDLTSGQVVDAWMEHVVCEDELARGGASETEAAANLRRGLKPPATGQYNAFGFSDGAAMRVGPIGVLCAGEPQRAAAMAEIDASVSHFRDGVWGAQAVAAAVSVAMVDGSVEEILSAAMAPVPKDSWLHYAMNTAFDILDTHGNRVLDAWMPLHDALRTSTWAAVPEAIPAVFACLKLENSGFREGVVLASNFARDADTIGAVAGAVLGAKYGASGIPEHWREKTRHPTGTCLSFTKGLDIFEIAQRLASLMI